MMHAMVNPTLGSASMSRATGRNQTSERKAMAKKRAPKRRVWNKGLEVGKRDGFTPHQVKRIAQDSTAMRKNIRGLALLATQRQLTDGSSTQKTGDSGARHGIFPGQSDRD